MVYREDLPIVDNISPREVPWDGEFQEFSAPSDLFTLNYRRAFNELMNRTARLDAANESTTTAPPVAAEG